MLDLNKIRHKLSRLVTRLTGWYPNHVFNVLGCGVIKKILVNNREIKHIKGEFKDPAEESKVPPKTDIGSIFK